MEFKRMRVAAIAVAGALAALLVGVGANLVGPAVGAADHRTTAPRAAAPPSVIRGTFDLRQVMQGDVYPLGGSLSFGWDIGRAPRVHVIKPGAPLPSKCRGSVAHPGARPGHLCVFEKTEINVAALQVCSASGQCGHSASSFGAWLETNSKLGGVAQVAGSWAVAPRR